MHTTPSRRHLLTTGLGLAGLAALPAMAQDKFPSRPITLVVPFPPGGSVDIMARQYSEPLSRVLGVPIVVENRAGAGGSVGAQYVARSKADGYTLVVSSQSSHLANPLTQPKIGYDPVKDFENIAILGRQPNALVVHSSLPFKTFKEFIDYAKKNPGKLNYGSGGVGSMGQLNVEMLKVSTGVFTTHIPYRGGTPLITGVLGNEVQFILDNLVIMLPHIQAGKVRALAVAADQRLPQLPDVPTMAEVGHPELNLTSWTGLAAPAGTPDAVVQTLYKAVRQVATSPAMVANLKDRGVIVPEEMSPAAFEKMMADRMVKFGAVVKRAGITAE
ncbi:MULTISPECIES: Bug family tripartite tricarboxylate transporter substrate binding protein [Acidovorax]|jgi:tripartite-type tricarboxylate transporter receptor subunit TctC|uniref:Bug family tripartite tricarboxylate transporter substrate binding protein n=1 Tax=Acidovorax TaxID=12916 RepID=UPI000C190025|nr:MULTISPECIES: tripartite tricarboxylate transporter substrate binding protein [unclassified Acidovorax]MBD9405870.1 tripartite tricarboxylate transporter substrate binding protein [Acidovorax sp. ACV02]MCT6717568.1 tripartite tricarboxylate transporter substrate binding protein [Acidovorax sp. K2F]PIF19528.1 tripartite-type tricarboxylate transporter receptor subunit TctC [Acidovorax sp. 59]PKW01443.1 tripartite-type tricarboxylate transporter receptor subunit TctC [Acidovorax sp. 30]PTT376